MMDELNAEDLIGELEDRGPVPVVVRSSVDLQDTPFRITDVYYDSIENRMVLTIDPK